jgi:hypothetical protein
LDVPATFSEVGEILESDIFVRFAVPDTLRDAVEMALEETFVTVTELETNKFTIDAVLFTVRTF